MFGMDNGIFGGGFGASAFGGGSADNGPAKPGTNAAGRRGSYGMEGYGRTSLIGGGGAVPRVREVAGGFLPSTLKLLHHHRHELGEGKLTLNGVDRVGVRLIGWVVKGSFDETDGEFMFQFTDGSGPVCQALISVGGSESSADSKAQRTKALIEKATLRGGFLAARVQLTGSAGLFADNVVIRVTHIRESDPVQAVIYHPLDCLKALLSPLDMSGPGDGFRLNKSTDIDGSTMNDEPVFDKASGKPPIALESLLSLQLPCEAQTQETQMTQLTDPDQRRLACAMFFLGSKKETKCARVSDILDLLCLYDDAKPREEYLHIIEQKCNDFEWWIPDPEADTELTENSEVYFLED